MKEQLNVWMVISMELEMGQQMELLRACWMA